MAGLGVKSVQLAWSIILNLNTVISRGTTIVRWVDDSTLYLFFSILSLEHYRLVISNSVISDPILDRRLVELTSLVPKGVSTFMPIRSVRMRITIVWRVMAWLWIVLPVCYTIPMFKSAEIPNTLTNNELNCSSCAIRKLWLQFCMVFYEFEHYVCIYYIYWYISLILCIIFITKTKNRNRKKKSSFKKCTKYISCLICSKGIVVTIVIDKFINITCCSTEKY